MEMLFTSRLEGLLGAVTEEMPVYVSVREAEHYNFRKFSPSDGGDVEFNNIRVCKPVKEFLFPMRELAAVYPEPASPEEVRAFAVFGLKNCDLKAIDILDRVFDEDDFRDPFYLARREKMFIISADCSDPGQSCCCNLFDGKPYPDEGFDLNVSKLKDGFVVGAGSEKGRLFISRNSKLFGDVPASVTQEMELNRAAAMKQLEENNAEYVFETPVREVVDNTQTSTVYDEEATDCIECQACTRVCPTCHCFYLYDMKLNDGFGKMKMWDSCVRLDFARVAGDANPRKILGERARHRLMHKFVYFLDRYGIDMCVGCGRCIDACAGEIEMREILKKLNEELKVAK